MGLEAVTFVGDLVATNPVGSTDPKSQGDDHLRNIKTALLNTFPGMLGAFSRVQSKAANYTVTAGDNTSIISCTSAGVTISLSSAASLGNGFNIGVYNAALAYITLDPAGTETINGYPTTEVYPGRLAFVHSNGTNFIAANDIPQPTVNPFVNSDMVFWPTGTSVVGTNVENHAALNYNLISQQQISPGLICSRVTATGLPSIGRANPQNAAKILVNAVVTVTASSYTAYKAYIEGFDFAKVANAPFGISFFMRSSLTGTYNLQIANAARNQFYGRNFVISSVNTWEYKTFRIPANPGTWLYTATRSIEIAVILGANALASTLPNDSWTAVSGIVTTTNVNIGATLSASARITAFNMWKSEDPFNWQPDDAGVRESRENRLFFKTFSRDTAPAHGQGTAGAVVMTAANIALSVESLFVPPMRGVSTAYTAVCWNPVNALAVGTASAAINLTTGADTSAVGTVNYRTLNINTSASVANSLIATHVSIDARMQRFAY